MPCAYVHPHIQRSVLETEGETSLSGVELVGGNSQIRQDSVHGRVAVITDKIVHETKVVVHDSQATVLGGVGQGFFVFVENDQPAFRSQAAQDLPTVAAAAQCRVHIDAVRADGKRCDALLEQDRRVVSRHRRFLQPLTENFLGQGCEIFAAHRLGLILLFVPNLDQMVVAGKDDLFVDADLVEHRLGDRHPSQFAVGLYIRSAPHVLPPQRGVFRIEEVQTTPDSFRITFPFIIGVHFEALCEERPFDYEAEAGAFAHTGFEGGREDQSSLVVDLGLVASDKLRHQILYAFSDVWSKGINNFPLSSKYFQNFPQNFSTPPAGPSAGPSEGLLLGLLPGAPQDLLRGPSA